MAAGFLLHCHLLQRPHLRLQPLHPLVEPGGLRLFVGDEERDPSELGEANRIPHQLTITLARLLSIGPHHLVQTFGNPATIAIEIVDLADGVDCLSAYCAMEYRHTHNVNSVDGVDPFYG
jgi:hypothetical protein